MTDWMAEFLEAFPGTDEADVQRELDEDFRGDSDGQEYVLEGAVQDHADAVDWVSSLDMAIKDLDVHAVDEDDNE